MTEPSLTTGSPAPSDIKSARVAAGLSQTAAAALVHSGLRTWQQWEAGDRRMHPGLWELFCIKANPDTMMMWLVADTDEHRQYRSSYGRPEKP